jgi:nitroreductase
MNQKKVTEASAVVVVIGNLNFVDHAEAVVDGMVERGYLPLERKEGMLAMANSFKQNPQGMREEAIRSSNLWAMAFMLVAKEAGWDTAPMGGFSAEALIKEFGLPESHFPVLLIAIGKVNSEVKILERNIRLSAKQLVHYDNW